MPALHLGVRSDVKPLSLALVCAALVHSAAFASVAVKRAERPKRVNVSNPHEPTVTLDVKDADVHDFLKPMAEQCGIRNLVIDPDVHGSGTFLFRGVPCRVAFETVFRSIGLSSIIYPNSVVTVSAKH